MVLERTLERGGRGGEGTWAGMGGVGEEHYQLVAVVMLRALARTLRGKSSPVTTLLAVSAVVFLVKRTERMGRLPGHGAPSAGEEVNVDAHN
jgi:hypothetical protein